MTLTNQNGIHQELQKNRTWLKHLKMKETWNIIHIYVSRTDQAWWKSPYLGENTLRVLFLGSIKVRRALMQLKNSLRVSVTSLPRRRLWRCRKAWQRADFIIPTEIPLSRKAARSWNPVQANRSVRDWMKSPMWTNDSSVVRLTLITRNVIPVIWPTTAWNVYSRRERTESERKGQRGPASFSDSPTIASR